jgi:hypothetical protein
MRRDDFTIADQITLANWGVADASERRPRSGDPLVRVLQAAADGMLIGPDLAAPDSPDELPIEIDGREASETEARAVADGIVDGHLVWIGCRIAITAAGRGVLGVIA